MKGLLKQDGFTLVELMVGITIMGILMAALFGLLIQSLKSWNANSHLTEVQQTARFAVDAIVKDAQYAKQIVITNENDITLIKLEGTTLHTLHYYLDTNDNILRCQTDKGVGQPVTGGNYFIATNVQPSIFSSLAENSKGEVRTLGIDLTMQDGQNAAYTYQLSTAVTANNVEP